MYPRRFARVRPSGRNSGLTKLIHRLIAGVIDYSVGGACRLAPIFRAGISKLVQQIAVHGEALGGQLPGRNFRS